MGNSNELASALAEASAAHMGNAVLGDDVVNIVFRGRADCARSEDGLDLAYSTALCGRGERNKALAALGLACAADEVDLAAGAGHVLCADGFSTDLAEEIDLDGCIYGYHVIVLADDLGIVYIVNGQDLDRRVIIDIVVDPLDRKSTRLNSSHANESRMPSSA